VKTKATMQLKPQNEMSILLVEDVVNKHSALKMALLKLNYRNSEQISSEAKLAEKCTQFSPDILIIDTEALTAYTLKELAIIDHLSPLPVIIFTAQETPSLIQSAIKVGVSTYIINGFETHRLTSVITVACERFKDRQILRNELKQTKTQLANRKIVERAKGCIMQQKQMSEQEAFTMLRKMAMNNGHSLATVSKDVIELSELLNAR
jgi:response regulator NasT